MSSCSALCGHFLSMGGDQGSSLRSLSLWTEAGSQQLASSFYRCPVSQEGTESCQNTSMLGFLACRLKEMFAYFAEVCGNTP